MIPETEAEAYELRSHTNTDTRTSTDMLSIRTVSRDPSPRPLFDRRDAISSDHTGSNCDDHNPRNSSIKSEKLTLWQKFQPFPWRIFAVISSLPVAVIPIVILATAAEEASVSYILGRDCYPNGKWKEENGATWRIMDSSYFFTPNLSFGSMTFTQVKVIDIAWDLCIGRGGQVLLAWVNYRVFNEWLVYHMEIHLTSYKMYTAMAFQTTTMSTLGVLGKEFLAFGEGTWKRFFRWLGMLCMLISTLYVLAFPTLMAAMTGYITTYEAYIEDNNHNLINFDKAVGVRYIIHDSARIGNYSNPLVVTLHDRNLLNAVDNYTAQYADTPWHPPLPNATFQPHTNWTTFFSSRASTFVWNKTVISLDKPTLNITLTVDGVWPNTVSPGLTYAYYSLSSNSSADSGRQDSYYTDVYLHNHGSCKPSETYQWGFSYIFLFMVAIFNFVWGCIMMGMWWDTVRGSRMYRAGRRPGLLRSVLDLASTIREELGEDAVENMDEDEIKKGLRTSGGRMIVPRGETRVGRCESENGRARKRSWKRSLTMGSTF